MLPNWKELLLPRKLGRCSAQMVSESSMQRTLHRPALYRSRGRYTGTCSRPAGADAERAASTEARSV